MQTVTVVTREKEPVVQNKDWESPASLPNVLKCDPGLQSKTRDYPLLSIRTANSSCPVCLHAAVGGGQEFWSHCRFLQQCQELSKGPPTESPAASGLALLPPTGPRASSTSFLGSLTSGHLNLAKNWDIYSSSVFPVSCSPQKLLWPFPLHPFFFLT